MGLNEILGVIIKVLVTAEILVDIAGIIALFCPVRSENGEIVYLNKFFLAIGVVCSAVFLIPTVICAFFDGGIGNAFCFLVFSFISLSLVIGFFNCRIVYDEMGFEHKNFLGIKREYTYSDITGVRYNADESYLFVGKKRILVDKYAVGADDFLNLARQRFSLANHGKQIPIEPRKKDIFKGHVKEPAKYYSLFALFAILILVLYGYFIYDIFLNPATTENTIETSVILMNFGKEDESIFMKGSDGELYEIRYFDENTDLERIKMLCKDKSLVTVYSVTVSPDDADDYFLVKAIFCDGEEILGFEESNRLYTENTRSLIFVPVIISAIFILWGVCAVIVGRNPSKFGRRIVKIFFDENHIKF